MAKSQDHDIKKILKMYQQSQQKADIKRINKKIASKQSAGINKLADKLRATGSQWN